jgi:hypothetical protein
MNFEIRDSKNEVRECPSLVRHPAKVGDARYTSILRSLVWNFELRVSILALSEAP